MSDTDTVNNEVEVGDDVDTNFELANGIVKDVMNNNLSDAGDKVQDAMLDKVRAVIAGEREEIASQMFAEPQAEVETEVEAEVEVELEDDLDDDVEEVEEIIDDNENETEEEDEDVQTD